MHILGLNDSVISTSLSVFKKIIVRNIPWQNLSNFLGVVLENFQSMFNYISYYMELIVVKQVSKEGKKQSSNQLSK